MWLIWTLAGAYNCSVQLLCCTQLCDRLSWTVTSVCVWSLFIHWPCFSLNLCDFTVHVWTRNSMGLYFIVSNTISKSNLQNNIYANKCSCYLNRCYTSSIVPLRLAIEKEWEREYMRHAPLQRAALLTWVQSREYEVIAVNIAVQRIYRRGYLSVNKQHLWPCRT